MIPFASLILLHFLSLSLSLLPAFTSVIIQILSHSSHFYFFFTFTPHFPFLQPKLGGSTEGKWASGCVVFSYLPELAQNRWLKSRNLIFFFPNALKICNWYFNVLWLRYIFFLPCTCHLHFWSVKTVYSSLGLKQTQDYLPAKINSFHFILITSYHVTANIWKWKPCFSLATYY